MTTIENDLQSFQADPAPRPSRNRRDWALLVTAFVLVAIISGAGGAVLTRLAFGPQVGADGAPGERGPEGPPGQTGPAGESGAQAETRPLDTNKVGYCFESTYQYNDNISWIDSVSLFAPTSVGGTLSCPYGQFVPLTPNGANGIPLRNYDATRAR